MSACAVTVIRNSGAGQLWEEMGEMDLNHCDALAELDSQQVFAIVSQVMKIYYIKCSGTGLRGDMKLGGVELKN